MAHRLVIDGAHGEGGGQILRTALTLAAVCGRPIRLEHIRAGRAKPGLAAQHVTAVRAAAALCRAEVSGDEIGSDRLDFAPQAPAAAGEYHFDVGAARIGGSAGSTSLVLQTVLLPLALAAGDSRLSIRGGTHLPWSPPFDHVQAVWLPLLARLGIRAEVALAAWGWFPIGQGEIRARVAGSGPGWRRRLRPLELRGRGRLRRIAGRAVAANLPAQARIPERMAERARALLEDRLPEGATVELRLAPIGVEAACAGAGIFLIAEYDQVRAGFSALGARGKPAERVAEEVVAELLACHEAGGALERHLADQILVPLALAPGVSRFSAQTATRHLLTNAWVIERFGLARITIDDGPRETALVAVHPSRPPE
jgi:RNA 3'-terminal phosphate cyclase (ATP)